MMKCPKCGKYADHQTFKTDPKRYYLGNKWTEMFKRRAKTDISYRRREKICSKCEASFISVEMWEGYLTAMRSEIEYLQDGHKQQASEMSELLKIISDTYIQLNSLNTNNIAAHKFMQRSKSLLIGMLRDSPEKAPFDVSTKDGKVIVHSGKRVSKKVIEFIDHNFGDLDPSFNMNIVRVVNME